MDSVNLPWSCKGCESKQIFLSRVKEGMFLGAGGFCCNCLEILWGLENYFDAFQHDFCDCPIVQEFLKKVNSDVLLRKELMWFRRRGRFIPTAVCEKYITSNQRVEVERFMRESEVFDLNPPYVFLESNWKNHP